MIRRPPHAHLQHARSPGARLAVAVACILCTGAALAQTAGAKKRPNPDGKPPAAALVTKADLGRFRLRLFRGSLRLGADEMPLIADEKYSLTAGGKACSHYCWREFRTTREGEALSVASADKGGALVRRFARSGDELRLEFRLTLGPELAGDPSFYYQLFLDPEFFFGVEDNADVALTALIGPSRTKREFAMPPFLTLRDRKLPRVALTNARELHLAWRDAGAPRSLTIQLADDAPAATLSFYDRRVDFRAYVLRVDLGKQDSPPPAIAFTLTLRLE